MRKFLTILIIFSFTLITKAQEVKKDSLSFNLMVIVNDVETTKPLDGCEVKIIGTDGSSQELITGYSGKTSSFKLKANTSYSIVIFKDRYLTGKGKETTVGTTRSKTFIHEYNIHPLTICTIRLYEQYYKHNSIVSYKAGPMWDGNYDTIPPNYYYDIMIENPILKMQITGYQDASENDNISIKRAKEYVNQLVKLGIDIDRLIAFDGGVRVYKKFASGRKNIEEEKEAENRMIDFRFISDNYKKN